MCRRCLNEEDPPSIRPNPQENQVAKEFREIMEEWNLMITHDADLTWKAPTCCKGTHHPVPTNKHSQWSWKTRPIGRSQVQSTVLEGGMDGPPEAACTPQQATNDKDADTHGKLSLTATEISSKK